MCRDVIVINGTKYTGIESVIRALVRSLFDAAERIRTLQLQKQQSSSQKSSETTSDSLMKWIIA